MGQKHLGLQILGLITLIGGVISFFAGLFYLSIGSALETEALESILLIIPLLSIGFAMAVMGAVMLIVGVGFAYLGWAVFKHRSWAYWTYFALTVLGLITSLVYMQVLGIIISGLIACYLYTVRNTFMSGSDIQFTWRD